MNSENIELNLENQFEIEKLKLLINNNPEIAKQLAISYLISWLGLSQDYYKLQFQCSELIILNEQLKTRLQKYEDKKKVVLPSFLNHQKNESKDSGIKMRD